MQYGRSFGRRSAADAFRLHIPSAMADVAATERAHQTTRQQWAAKMEQAEHEFSDMLSREDLESMRLQLIKQHLFLSSRTYVLQFFFLICQFASMFFFDGSHAHFEFGFCGLQHLHLTGEVV